MEYRRLGRSDLRVSVICLGTMTFGEQNSEADGHQQMDYALDHGVNFFDTAEMYAVPPRRETYGRTEEIIGTWFKSRGKRDKVVLASKIVGPDERFPYVRDGNLRFDRKNIQAAVDASLKRLQTDYIDLYQLHWPEREVNVFGQLLYKHNENQDWTPFEETLDALQEVVKAGKVRQVGLSNETAWGAMSWLKLAEQGKGPRMASIQNAYSLLNRAFEVGVAEVAIREDCGLLAFSPLGMGVLSGKYLDGAEPAGARLTLYGFFKRYRSARGEAATKAYVNLARRHGLDPAQMALAFINSRRFVTANIIGATTMEQLKSNIASADLKLSDDVLTEIDALHHEHTIPCP
ncbi:NADP(H)-dependent aldo-keto reductase [Dongia soli]|uniref:NADP(H)-dependent aldo-keto reductase n=1 Tax=Dongia soli TaxID=600628 RepID=A0ABU5E874_9PROT|nr:NADP(H)-dependent aldo-keto reductase [Dongia soli]MDY0882051.1 NADP(H)-dependent aldo-keto reductase [Dongia soli]